MALFQGLGAAPACLSNGAWQDVCSDAGYTLFRGTKGTMRGGGSRVPAIMGPEVDKLMKTYVQYPPRKLQSAIYSGPITITNYQKFQYLRDTLAKDGISLGIPN